MFVSLLVFFNMLSENLLALLAGENQFGGWKQFVVFPLLVALWAVEPLLAAWSSDSNLGV